MGGMFALQLVPMGSTEVRHCGGGCIQTLFAFLPHPPCDDDDDGHYYYHREMSSGIKWKDATLDIGFPDSLELVPLLADGKFPVGRGLWVWSARDVAPRR